MNTILIHKECGGELKPIGIPDTCFCKTCGKVIELEDSLKNYIIGV